MVQKQNHPRDPLIRLVKLLDEKNRGWKSCDTLSFSLVKFPVEKVVLEDKERNLKSHWKVCKNLVTLPTPWKQRKFKQSFKFIMGQEVPIKKYTHKRTTKLSFVWKKWKKESLVSKRYKRKFSLYLKCWKTGESFAKFQWLGKWLGCIVLK